MNLETWKIIPDGLSGIHLGKQGMAQERSSIIFHSDSLFSALVLTMATITDDANVDEMLEEFRLDEPPFLITSAFPYAGNVRFFPLPLNVAIDDFHSKGEKIPDTKAIKRISFVSEEIFRKILADKTLLIEFLTEKNILKGGLLVSGDEKQHLPTNIQNGTMRIFDDHEKRPRVTIGREDNTSNLFFTGAVQYAPGCGMWFGIRWQKDKTSWKDNLPTLFSVLEDEGIGGERSSGFGQVKIKPWQNILLPDAAGRHWMTLSRYLPKFEEVSALYDENAGYSLDNVGGWLQSPGYSSQRRKTINMLREGSVFGPLDEQPIGKMVEIQPEYKTVNFDAHPVYRSGLTIGVGFSKENSK